MDGKAVLWKNANKTTTSPWSVAALETIMPITKRNGINHALKRGYKQFHSQQIAPFPPTGKSENCVAASFYYLYGIYKDIKLECPNRLLIKDTLPLEAYKRLNCIS